MVEHHATITWQTAAQPADFVRGKYSREHAWDFDGGVSVPASPSPAIVPMPWSNPAGVDPEEAFVAALSSCHMLTFLHLAAKAGHAVLSYRDAAVGVMTKNAHGVLWVSAVTLHPQITWAGPPPTAGQVAELHHAAHEQCFISQSVKTKVSVAPG
jgi:organic hydroperoxide reductase OsmC/OhrA